MHIVRSQGHSARIASYPVDGAGSDIKSGALLMPGVTGEDNRGVAILATSAAADAIGILAEFHEFANGGDTTMEDGLVEVRREINIIQPGVEVAAEFSHLAADDVAVASFSTATVTVTTMEDDIDGGWMYVISGPSAGLLAYIKQSDSGSFILKTTPTTALTSSSLISVMRPRLHLTNALSADSTKLRTLNTAGTLPWRTLDLQIKEPDSSIWVSLNATLHDNIVYANATGAFAPKFRAILSPADTLLNPLD